MSEMNHKSRQENALTSSCFEGYVDTPYSAGLKTTHKSASEKNVEKKQNFFFFSITSSSKKMSDAMTKHKHRKTKQHHNKERCIIGRTYTSIDFV